MPLHFSPKVTGRSIVHPQVKCIGSLKARAELKNLLQAPIPWFADLRNGHVLLPGNRDTAECAHMRTAAI